VAIEVRTSSIHGRGAYATRDIAEGEAFHVAPLLLFPCAEADALQGTRAADYVFHVEDCPDHPGRSIVGLAMSPMSFVNHSARASAAFAVDPKAETITFTALRAIVDGEEITIDYGDFAEKLGIA
jgi:hypothetical protein